MFGVNNEHMADSTAEFLSYKQLINIKKNKKLQQLNKKANRSGMWEEATV